MTQASSYTPHAQVSPNAIPEQETRRVIVSMQNCMKAMQAHLAANPIGAASTGAVASASTTVIDNSSSSSSTSSGLDANQTAQLANAIQGAQNEGTAGIGVYDTTNSSRNLLLKNINTDGTYLGIADNPTTKVVTVSANIGQVSNKLAAGDDNRFPTTDQKAALAGTDGTPSATDKYVTDSDPRNTNARTPTAHAATHTNGTDEIANFVGDSGSGGTAGFVPAPAIGDAAAGKFLKANGGWSVPLSPLHNDLPGLQGGTSGQYYHLTSAQQAIVAALPAASGSASTYLNGAGAYTTPASSSGVVWSILQQTLAIHGGF